MKSFLLHLLSVSLLFLFFSMPQPPAAAASAAAPQQISAVTGSVSPLASPSVSHRPSQPASPRQPTPLVPCATPSDTCWQDGFHLPGVTGIVYAMAQDGLGNIYVGGDIISAGGIPVQNIARWDGARWSDMGGGLAHSTPTWQRVEALAVDEANNLYAGGVFDHAGETLLRNLAKWNGSSWQDLGGGVEGGVLALEAANGGLYVAGFFTQAGTVSAANIAYFNFQSASWLALGSGTDDAVHTIVFEPNSGWLYAGGDFSTAGGVEAIRLARYKGAAIWEAVGGGLFNTGGIVHALLTVPRPGGGHDLYVGGEFTQVGYTVDVHNIARWDGAAWSALNAGVNGAVFSLQNNPATGEIIAAGDFTTAGPAPGLAANRIAKWSDSAWSVLGNGVGAGFYEEINDVLLSNGNILAGGGFKLAGELVVNNLARWDGAAWRSLDGGLGVNNVVELLLADNNAVLAAGGIDNFGSLQAIGLAKLSGVTWSGEANPTPAFLRTLVRDGTSTLIVGGAFTSIGATTAKYLARWNGVSWGQYAGGTNGVVNALARAASGKLYVGGDFTQAGESNPAQHIAMYDGAWHSLGEGLDGDVRVLALDGAGNLFAAGEFYYAGGLFVNHIAMWDGSAWHALGGGLSGSPYIEALVFDGDGRLYAGGYFGGAGGKTVNGVAMWNGYEWSALGSGMNDGVGALALDASGYLYAGGDFDMTGDGLTSIKHIARWDGFAWSALGSGTDKSVFTLAVPTSDRLVAGGVFKKAGGNAASYIGVYSFPPPVAAPAPQLINLTPSSILSGAAGFWLAVNGSSFSSRSVVRWNGDTLVTTYVNSSQLKAFVPAGRIQNSEMAFITVFTPAPSGGGSSLSLPFDVVEIYKVCLPVVSK